MYNMCTGCGAKKLPVCYFENRPKLELKFQDGLKKKDLWQKFGKAFSVW